MMDMSPSKMGQMMKMKRIDMVLAGILLIVPVLTGCNLQTDKPTPVPTTPTQNQNVTGLFGGVKVPAGGGNATVNVQTSNGTQTFVISPNATLTLGGQACTIDDLAAIQVGNTSYNCTVVVNDQMGVFGVYVTGGSVK
mgnify:CR=1 FL=1